MARGRERERWNGTAQIMFTRYVIDVSCVNMYA